MPRGNAGIDQVMRQGNLIYLDDGNNSYPARGDIYGRLFVAYWEEFEFRPGKMPLAGVAGSTLSGAVVSGTRTGAATTTSGTVASSTYWGSWIPFNHMRSGKIDGQTTGGILSGQVTVGLKVGAGTGTVAPTFQLANTANTAAPTTVLALATTVTCSTAEAYASYDLNYLQTDAVMNSVPFSIRMGVQHGQAGSTAIFRIMESSRIIGKFEVIS